MEKPLISVIVPIYKDEAYIHQCVDSILNQTYNNLEIILVDDGSPCKCPEICDAYAAKDNRVVVLHQENSGPSVARNNALDICRGEYIAFVDGDDWLEETAYEDMMEMMLANKLDVVFCTANIIVHDAIVEERFAFFENNTILPPEKLVALSLTDEIGGQVWMKLWHRRCWENVRFPAGRIYEDLAISYQPFVHAVGNVGFLKKPLYNYRMNSEGISLSRNSRRAYDIFRGFREHYEYASAHFKEVAEACLVTTINTAVSTYNRQITAEDSWNAEWVKEVKSWVRSHKPQIMGCKGLSVAKRVSIWILIYAEPVYRLLYPLYYQIAKRIRRRNE